MILARRGIGPAAVLAAGRVAGMLARTVVRTAAGTVARALAGMVAGTVTRMAAGLVAGVAAGMVAGMVTAPPAYASACAGSNGVTVVVDFRSLGGGVQTGCAPGDPASGLAALSAAGFGYTVASRQPGFVCRIDGKPASDPCVNTSPATAYWAYWHASRGGSWTYSSLGAGGYDPAPGSVEGWAFGSGQQPGVSPPAPPATPAPPSPPAPPPGSQPAPPAATSPAAVQPTPPGRGRATAGPATPPAASSGPPSDPARAPSAGPGAGASPSTPAGAAAGPDGSESVSAPVHAEPDPAADSSGVTGGVAGVLVVAVLAGLAVCTAVRRNRGTR